MMGLGRAIFEVEANDTCLTILVCVGLKSASNGNE